MNKHHCCDTKDDGHQRGQQQTDVLGLRVCGQAADGEHDRDSSKNVDDDGHGSLVPHALPEVLDPGLLGRVREVVELFLERLILRCKFLNLRLESRVLSLQLDNLSERNRRLRSRLLGLRRWHVQYPPVDEAGASAVEHEQKAGAELAAPHEAGRLGGDLVATAQTLVL